MTKAIEMLRAIGHKQVELARILGTTPQSIHQWLMEGVRPSDEMIVKMRDKLNIPVTAWFESPKKRRAQ
jgi:transcriptional regulator with XRE-family HTH domain